MHLNLTFLCEPGWDCNDVRAKVNLFDAIENVASGLDRVQDLLDGEESRDYRPRRFLGHYDSTNRLFRRSFSPDNKGLHDVRELMKGSTVYQKCFMAMRGTL